MINNISVVIPVWNEEGSVQLLVERLHHAFSKRTITYELIFVDDHSKDQTLQILTRLALVYPINLVIKKGAKGKARSLLEGFALARYNLIAMIDADLQYPPEAIPSMMAKIGKEIDIVVANRRESSASIKRRLLSFGFRSLFGKFLHGFDCDIQSGLKVFRRDIIERIKLNPSPWTFDLEFLVKARNAGYKIGTVSVIFRNRLWGVPKIGLLYASLQMVKSAISLYIESPQIVPFHYQMQKKKGRGFHYKGMEFVHHSDLPHSESAFHRVSLPQVVVLSFIITLITIGLLENWHVTITISIALLTVLYFSDLLFNFFLIYRSFSRPPEIIVKDDEIAVVPERNWPTYSVLCPLYREWEVLPQFVTAMSRLDYPKDKLQVLLLLEEDDLATVEKVRTYNLPAYFQIITVPHSLPKTKPKALNYGLIFATGEYAVVYDAEDIPEPKQLKKAVLAFKISDERTICIQAKLNFYNPHQNFLTRVFAAEYSLWFDLVLTGLQSIHAPIPLGGTSNHFRTENLRMLKGWDAFNVTEDCDLGMRLVKRGYRTAVVDSLTNEEANSDLGNWFAQRTRWIKGYIQSYLVHMRNPREFMRDWKRPHVVTFQLIVGGKILSMFINPLMWFITLSYFALRPWVGTFIESFFPTPVLYMGVISLVLGNFLYMYYYMIGCYKRDYDDIMKYIFLVPVYWLFMSISAGKAIYKIIRDPHYWSKTNHGMHLSHRKAVAQATKVVGQELVDFAMTSYVPAFSDRKQAAKPAVSPQIAYPVVYSHGFVKLAVV